MAYGIAGKRSISVTVSYLRPRRKLAKAFASWWTTMAAGGEIVPAVSMKTIWAAEFAPRVIIRTAGSAIIKNDPAQTAVCVAVPGNTAFLCGKLSSSAQYYIDRQRTDLRYAL